MRVEHIGDCTLYLGDAPIQMRLFKKGFPMCRAGRQPSNNIGARFAAVVARPAKRDQVFKRIGRCDAPRDNVMHIQAAALSCQCFLSSPTVFALTPIADTRRLRLSSPISAALVVDGCATLPLRAVRAAFSPRTRQRVTIVAAKPFLFAIKSLKPRPAMGARFGGRLNAAPTCFVIAGHVAKAARSRVVSKCFKSLAASFASFGNARFGLTLPAPNPPVPRGASIGPCAIHAAILAPRSSGKWLGALGAGVMDRFCHAEIITIARSKINYFDIACRRVEEAYRQPDMFIQPPAPKPEQITFDMVDK